MTELIERVAKKMGWTFLDGKRWYKSESDDTVMVQVDFYIAGYSRQHLTADGAVMLLEWVLDRGCMFDKTANGYFIWKWDSRIAGRHGIKVADGDTLAEALLRAIDGSES